ncbi:hypothetical protein [Cupriavidus oxalaticus]|uniref:hypothetical protein n=1 Tax=Cupriavidus TaxID=106589 RepID=UPI00197AFCB7|nr:hypothetical protein [Cupriavidus oxalaticus]
MRPTLFHEGRNSLLRVVGRGHLAERIKGVQPAMSRQVWICRSATMPVTLAASTVWTQLLEITAGLVDGGVWPARSVRRPGS